MSDPFQTRRAYYGFPSAADHAVFRLRLGRFDRVTVPSAQASTLETLGWPGWAFPSKDARLDSPGFFEEFMLDRFLAGVIRLVRERRLLLIGLVGLLTVVSAVALRKLEAD